MALGHQVVRYSHDIATPAPDWPTAERALELATAEAKRLRLELNIEDSRALAFDDGVPFLGQTITATTGAGTDPLSHPQRTTVYVATEGVRVLSFSWSARCARSDPASDEAGIQGAPAGSVRQSRSASPRSAVVAPTA